MAEVKTTCSEKRNNVRKEHYVTMMLLTAVHQVRFVPHQQTTCFFFLQDLT